MSTTSQLAKRFREVLLDGKWIANTNFKEHLSDVTLEQATTKIDSLNTIAMLTFHIDYYIAGLVNVFEGGDLEIKDKFSFDLPPIESQEQWESTLNKLWQDSEKFANLLEQMQDSKLDEIFVDEKYGTYLRNIDGMIEHAYYHLGQITLIKKMILFKY
ncbi:DinB family protein [Chryseobacterium sp. LC2016-29]|uniref:DinB family protein n=1 Tax=Chryseobacterium sp. LC2016-29 TaxID=2897331 RepID=UPI001E2FF56B|nr:DinB family protein [Chryseobacterium sp. LC2016-29]MCD0476821.1 DinB family protein [Chryseobacterium sp. LC2016-29]